MAKKSLPHYERFIRNLKMGADDECWNYGKNRHYARIREGGAGSKQWQAHRYAYWIFNGRSVPDELVIMHTCDNPRCVNPHHLRIGTTKDNAHDMVQKNRWRGGFMPGPDARRLFGASHPMSKLTDADVVSIRQDPRSQKQLARAYGVSPKLIHNIKAGKAWKHV